MSRSFTLFCCAFETQPGIACCCRGLVEPWNHQLFEVVCLAWKVCSCLTSLLSTKFQWFQYWQRNIFSTHTNERTPKADFSWILPEFLRLHLLWCALPCLIGNIPIRVRIYEIVVRIFVHSLLHANMALHRHRRYSRCVESPRAHYAQAQQQHPVQHAITIAWHWLCTTGTGIFTLLRAQILSMKDIVKCKQCGPNNYAILYFKFMHTKCTVACYCNTTLL